MGEKSFLDMINEYAVNYDEASKPLEGSEWHQTPGGVVLTWDVNVSLGFGPRPWLYCIDLVETFDGQDRVPVMRNGYWDTPAEALQAASVVMGTKEFYWSARKSIAQMDEIRKDRT